MPASLRDDAPPPDMGDQERADLLAALAKQRSFLRFTVQNLGDDDAARRTTVSELCLGGVLKHVTAVEGMWAEFIERGPEAIGAMDASAMQAHAASFRMLPGETVDGLLDAYRTTAERTDELVRTLPSLDRSHPLPEAPWFPPGARWTARAVVLHIVAETAQHAGHADILREAVDGQKTMG